MLNNKADAVENYILKVLAENQTGQVELKRTDLANEVSCAPSQVSYVLSTRFTSSRGFKVESQRGLGGYIRITIMDEREAKRKILLQKISEIMKDVDATFDDIKKCLELLLQEKFITVREAEIIIHAAYRLYEIEALGEDVMDPEIRASVLDAMFAAVSKFS